MTVRKTALLALAASLAATAPATAQQCGGDFA